MGELGNAAVAALAIPAVQGVLLLVAIIALVVWQRDADRKEFDLIELVVDRGRLSGRKLFETGAFLLTSIWFMGRIMSGTADVTDALGYAGLWAVARTAGQIVHTRAEAAQKAAGGDDVGNA